MSPFPPLCRVQLVQAKGDWTSSGSSTLEFNIGSDSISSQRKSLRGPVILNRVILHDRFVLYRFIETCETYLIKYIHFKLLHYYLYTSSFIIYNFRRLPVHRQEKNEVRIKVSPKLFTYVLIRVRWDKSWPIG